MKKVAFLILVLIFLVPQVIAQQVDTYNLPSRPLDIALSFDGSSLYVFTTLNQVLRIQTASGAVVETFLNQQELPPELSQSISYKGFDFDINPLDNSLTAVCSENGEEPVKIQVGDRPSTFVISEDGVMYVANTDNTISVVDLNQILRSAPPCQRSYFGLFIAALVGTVIFFAITVWLGVNHISLIQEEKKIARFILTHLRKGHKIEDIHSHLHKYKHPHHVARATNRAYAHIERKNQGKKSNLV